MRARSITASGLSMAVLVAGCGPAETGSDGQEGASLPPFARSFDAQIVPRAAVCGADGSVFFGGTFQGDVDLGGGTHSSAPFGSVLVAHLDAAGGHLWSGSTGSKDQLHGVAAGPGGELYAVGGFDGSINFGSGKLVGDDDAFLAAFEPGGASDHSFTAGGLSSDRFEGVAVTPAGEVVVAGRMGDDADLGGGAPSAELTEIQPVIAAYDGDGGHLWELRFTANLATELAVAADGAGNVLVAAVSYGPVSIGGLTGGQGLFVAKIGPGGEPLWLTATGGEGFPSLYHSNLAVDALGGVYLAGMYSGTFSIGGLEAPFAEELNGHVIKLDPQGKGLFLSTFVTTNYSSTLRLAVSREGEPVIGLTTYGEVDFGTGPVGSPDSYDVIVARLAADGSVESAKRLEGNGSEYVHALAVGPDGKAVVLGSFDDLLDIGETRLVADGGQGLFLARLE